MWHKLNSVLRTRTPGIHKHLKRATQQWRTSQKNPIPVPNVVAGQLSFLHPFFLTHDKCEPQVQTQLQSWLKPGDTFIDVGANFGFHTLLASKLVGKKGRVMAFEPSIENLKILEYHCRVNALKNVSIYPDALGNEVKSAVDFVLIDGGMHSSNSLTIKEDVLYISREQKKITQVSMKTIDSVCDEADIKPNLIKIDVEGAELLVLEGARKTLIQHRPTIILGLHPFWMPEGHTPNLVAEFFRELDYILVTIENKAVNELVYGDYIAYPSELKT